MRNVTQPGGAPVPRQLVAEVYQDEGGLKVDDWTFEAASRATAGRAACRLAGRRRLPRGTHWESLP